MIKREELVPGARYDGFLWVAGRQRGTGYLRWNGSMFEEDDYVCSFKGEEDLDGFEPNLGPRQADD